MVQTLEVTYSTKNPLVNESFSVLAREIGESGPFVQHPSHMSLHMSHTVKIAGSQPGKLPLMKSYNETMGIELFRSLPLPPPESAVLHRTGAAFTHQLHAQQLTRDSPSTQVRADVVLRCSSVRGLRRKRLASDQPRMPCPDHRPCSI